MKNVKHLPCTTPSTSTRRTRRGAIHEHSPAGSKLLKRAYKVKTGTKATELRNSDGDVLLTAYEVAGRYFAQLRLPAIKHASPYRIPFAQR